MIKGLGLYEEGMKLEEMKQVMQALEESQLECETAFFESDLEHARKESELEYVQMHCDAHSSTMIMQANEVHNENIVKSVTHCHNTPMHSFPNSDTSPFSSPEITAKKLVVEAIVHHELNWSPPRKNNKIDECFRPKCLNSSYNNGNTEKRKVVENEVVVFGAKRSKRPTTSSPKTFGRSDSGIHLDLNLEDIDKSNEHYQSDPSL
ncbi:uncharacterized protein LOC118751707 [Rhagoletis pomonella]|uniref:uncharacterized protein LOC118751702 n=1 Tax=Rhagoletis pomonella TaxID=28610 RepID=UPI0017811D55|nr:uncharacterized protein LOC118751702 [Rhagoletis pomonella]XP_036342414.1 uncharacterized protein LOC118751707 [Rhagoletis pomonella]